MSYYITQSIILQYYFGIFTNLFSGEIFAGKTGLRAGIAIMSHSNYIVYRLGFMRIFHVSGRGIVE